MLHSVAPAMELNKLSAFETKCENKLLGQGDAVEHLFHAWARDEKRRATHSPAERTRWKLPVVVPWRANPDNCAPKLSRPGYIGVLRVAELPRSILRAFVMTTREWPGTLLHNRRAAKVFQGLIPRGCSRIEIPSSSARTLPG